MNNRLRIMLVLGVLVTTGLAGYLVITGHFNPLTSRTVETAGAFPSDVAEPEMAAGRSGSFGHRPLSVFLNSVTPLRFGGLVSIDDGMFIELTPDGNVLASGDISGQTTYSHIGGINLANYSGNDFYKIHHGIIEFSVEGLQERGTLTVEFMPGVLNVEGIDEGVTLSNMSINISAADGLMPVEPAKADVLNYSNRIEFKATEDITSARVRLAFGGRLSIAGDSDVNGELTAKLPIKVSAENPTAQWTKCAHENYFCAVPGPAIVRYGARGYYNTKYVSRGGIRCTNRRFGDPISGVYKKCEYQLKGISNLGPPITVYEHVNFQGRLWQLDHERSYSIDEIQKFIGNDIISSIKVQSGYKLKACEHASLGGRCEYITNDVSDLRAMRFNDIISSMQVIKKW